MILKPATELHEFLQIHQLNYKTFVEEIPQHKPNPEKTLMDRYHNKNNYIVAMKENVVVGMVCYICDRPFSLDAKVADLDRFLPKHQKLVEIRLLSVCSHERKTTIAYRLLQFLCHTLIQQHVDAAVISGTTRQIRLYSRMGFIPFGELVGSNGAMYQPMFITLKNLRHDFKTS